MVFCLPYNKTLLSKLVQLRWLGIGLVFHALIDLVSIYKQPPTSLRPPKIIKLGSYLPLDLIHGKFFTYTCTNYLLAESEVFTGKSQTETLLY